MVKIYRTTRADMNVVSEFIERLNSDSKNHIGYCAKKKEEIEKALMEDFYDEDAEGQIFAAMKDETIIGVLGCDCDIEEGCGEVWGPFIDEEDHEIWQHIALLLWNNLKENCEKIKDYGMFIDCHNERAINFAKNRGARFGSNEEILVLNKEDFKFNYFQEVKEITRDLYDGVIELHDESFKGSYLKGIKLIDRISLSRKVFISEKDSKVSGYIYIEVEEDFGEATIEFLGVAKEARNKGLGYKLLNKGIEWIFSFENIEHIELCVRSSNETAVNLYKRNGFKTETILEWFKLSI